MATVRCHVGQISNLITSSVLPVNGLGFLLKREPFRISLLNFNLLLFCPGGDIRQHLFPCRGLLVQQGQNLLVV